MRPLIRILNSPVTYLIIGVPYILLAQWAANMAFVGLSSFHKQFNAEQEWLARAGGWLMVTAAGWNVLIFLIFAGFLAGALDTPTLPFFVTYFVIPICIVWGFAIALVGTFSMTRFTFEPRSVLAVFMNAALAAAAPLFVGALIFTLSIGLDYLLLDGHLFGPNFRTMTRALQGGTPDYTLLASDPGAAVHRIRARFGGRLHCVGVHQHQSVFAARALPQPPDPRLSRRVARAHARSVHRA